MLFKKNKNDTDVLSICCVRIGFLITSNLRVVLLQMYQSNIRQ